MYRPIGVRFDSSSPAIYNERENMEAILKFDLPDDKTEFEAATKSMDWAILAWDIEQYIRNRLKYQSEKLDTSSAKEELELLRNELHELMEDSGLQFLP